MIHIIDNTASLTYAKNTVNSNSVSTLLALPPTIVKAVDKLSANIGDTLTYTIPSIPVLGSAIITFQVKVVGGSN